jgi:hypothetical protein
MPHEIGFKFQRGIIMSNVRLIKIEEGDKFFNFIEEMLNENKRNGFARMKDGTVKPFRYVIQEIRNGKKIHYIQI